MLYLVALILGIIAGKFFNGKFSNMLNCSFNKAYLVVIALVIQSVPYIPMKFGMRTFDKYNIIIPALASVFILIAFWFNRHYKGIMFFGIGMALNTLVMIINGGKMPVSYDLLISCGYESQVEILRTGSDIRHILMNENTRLWFMSDIIRIPGFLGYLMGIVSVGDLFIVVGVFIIGYEVMRFKKNRMSGFI